MDMTSKSDSGGRSLSVLLQHLRWLEQGGGSDGDAGGGCTIFLDQNEPNVTVTVRHPFEGTTGQGENDGWVAEQPLLHHCVNTHTH